MLASAGVDPPDAGLALALKQRPHDSRGEQQVPLDADREAVGVQPGREPAVLGPGLITEVGAQLGLDPALPDEREPLLGLLGEELRDRLGAQCPIPMISSSLARPGLMRL